MTKKILGLDLGTTSIGWALVNEAENENETSGIIKLGVRVNPLTTDEQTDFEKGNPLSLNADRTLKRSARRNLQRYKQRRQNLIDIFKREGFINNSTILSEEGKGTTHQTWELRSKAAIQQIGLDEFVRVLLAINKKRGYKSSRKANSDDEGVVVDGMSIAKTLYDENLTPGQYVFQTLKEGKKYIPDFYRSDLQNEFDLIWNFQKQFYPEVLTEDLYQSLQGQGQQNSRKRFLAIKGIYTAENKGKRDETRLKQYQWRTDAINTQLKIEEVAYVLVEINNNLNKSSGYLGKISDRSKELYFNEQTIGQYIYSKLQENFHYKTKNIVFYRQDYLDEFEIIWETQAKTNPLLCERLKEEIRDVIIFYQRKLKSQKHLISGCQFEKHHKACPKSSPLFQEARIWQMLNNVEIQNLETKEINILSEEDRQFLFEELNLRGDLKASEVLKTLGLKPKLWQLNYTEGLVGNRTNAKLYNVFHEIAECEGYGFDWKKKSAAEIKEELIKTFPLIGIDNSVLDFDANISGNQFDKQLSYRLWHLLYSAEDDGSVSAEDVEIYGNTNVRLKKALHKIFGFKVEYAAMLANICFEKDHANLSAKAIRKIIPHLEAGCKYHIACDMAGYNHSSSKTKEELANRVLKEKLSLLQKNSLRNPVVEKILNQMINLVNQVIEEYGKPDEVRVELARELKKSAKERKELTENMNSATRRHEEIRKILQKAPFMLANPTRNDVIRYKLYQELSDNGYKTLYTNKYISPEQLFSKEIDIEHIIPKALLFDDSFSNKTLEFRDVNLKKSDKTAFDFMEDNYSKDIEQYKARVENLHASYQKSKGSKDVRGISKGKYKKLLMSESELPNDFIERDLRNSQYIAKKAKEILFDAIRTVNTTTGSVTGKLREDWGLINVMKELNLPKYRNLGLTEIQERKNDQKVEIIKDWTKRNDHRHHAMDALTVAFTTYDHVNYLNNLHASRNKESNLYGVRDKITQKVETNNGNSKRVFTPPLPNFRQEAKQHLEQILISFKSKSKVVTKNINRYKVNGEVKQKVQLTPRGQLHKETVYGKIRQQLVKLEKIGSKTTQDIINNVCNPVYQEVLQARFNENGCDPKRAFAGKNALSKKPIYLNNERTKELPERVKIISVTEQYTIRKDITPDLKIEKVIDQGVRSILQQRLDEYNGDAKKAFVDLDKNPIWLNKEKGISIKRVTISGVKNAEALHSKRDKDGKLLLDENGKTQAVDFVSTGNNHHVAIYRDEKGNLQEKVVSFYEAVARVNSGEPIVDYHYNESLGWTFLFTMKQNEMFVFPSDNFDPNEIDLMDVRNYSEISKNLYRVQKIATKNYFFRHHLETTVEEIKELKSLAYKPQLGLKGIVDIVKIRINHLGKIVAIGEEKHAEIKQLV